MPAKKRTSPKPKKTAARKQVKTHRTFEEGLAGLESLRKKLQKPPGDELTRAIALGTWCSFFGEYSAFEKIAGLTPFQLGVIRSQYAGVHSAATDYLLRLAATMGIDGTALQSAGSLCRLLAKQAADLIDLDAQSCLWPDCIGRNRYELPQGQQSTIEAGERMIQKLRLKVGFKREQDDPALWSKVDFPEQHAKTLDIKRTTFYRLRKRGQIRWRATSKKQGQYYLPDGDKYRVQQ